MGQCFDKSLTNQIRTFFADVQKYPTKNILLLFSQVEAMDSTGIGILVNFQEELEQQHYSLKLINVSSKILHLFEILGLASFFHIYPTEAEALASFFAEPERNLFSQSDWEKAVAVITDNQEPTYTPPKNAPSQIIPVSLESSNTPHNATDIEPSTPIVAPNSPPNLVNIDMKNDKENVLENINPEPSSVLADGDALSNDIEELTPEAKSSVIKRLHTIKIKKKGDEGVRNQFLLKVEYYTPMLCQQEFPLKIAMFGSPSRKSKTWEIIPKVAGCMVIPQRISIHDFELPMEFTFSLIPMKKAITSSELLLSSKHSSLKQFSLKTNVLSTEVPKLSIILGVIISFLSLTTLISTWLLQSFRFSRNDMNLNPLAEMFIYVLGGLSLYGFIGASILLLAAFLYYHYWLQPKKISAQLAFYEKEE